MNTNQYTQKTLEALQAAQQLAVAISTTFRLSPSRFMIMS